MQGDNNSIHFMDQFFHLFAAFGILNQCNCDITADLVLNQGAVGMLNARDLLQRYWRRANVLRAEHYMM